MAQLIGAPLSRIDGPDKVTGTARYAGDFKQPGLVHGVLVTSTIAHGRIQGIDAAGALGLPGVLAVMTHENAPRLAGLAKNKSSAETPTDRELQLLQDDQVHYDRQPIAVVLAATLEQATAAAALVRVSYAAQPPVFGLPAGVAQAYTPAPKPGAAASPARGDVAGALAAAPVKLDQTYQTTVMSHNALEPHAVLAYWEGDQLTVHGATQGISAYQKRIAELFGMPPDNVRVLAEYVGGGFGSKGTTFSPMLLGPMAARLLGRPVRLVLKREQMFGMVGSRGATHQRLRLGAGPDGQLTALAHDGISQTSTYDEFAETTGASSRMLYACPNLATSQQLVRASVGPAAPMRGPGEASGVFALESALDELAYQLNLDPVALRLTNYAEQDPDKNRPFSSKSLRQCYAQGAARFGWAARAPQPRARREGTELVGLGMATTLYPVNRAESSARVRLTADGRVQLDLGTQDPGVGSYTIFTQLAADVLGVAPAQVTLHAGDSRLPESTISGGSRNTASGGSAVVEAARAVLRQASQLAIQDPKSPLFNTAEAELVAKGGRLHLRADPARGEALPDLLRRHGGQPLEATVKSAPGAEKDQYSMYGFGAVFVEVRVDEALGRVRLLRMQATVAGGRIVNEKTARSQLLGGMVWAASMALLEDTHRDPRTARVMNPNLAEYHVPVNADIGELDCVFVPEDDPVVNPAGVKGLGEMGVVGTTAAIANAIYHATGRRHRALPITPDKVMA